MTKMPSLERLDATTLGLTALNVALLAGLLTIALWPISGEKADPAPAAIPSAVPRTTSPPFSAPQLPLFGRSQNASPSQTANRAPQMANAAPPPSAAEARPLQWRVTGIIIAEGAAPIALIERKGQTTETRRVTVGAAVEGWTVEHIASRTVSFRRDTVSIVAPLDLTNDIDKSQSPPMRGP